MEAWYSVHDLPWATEGSLTLSNGDQTGFSIHGDFINGFSEGDGTGTSILSKALTECTSMMGCEYGWA